MLRYEKERNKKMCHAQGDDTAVECTKGSDMMETSKSDTPEARIRDLSMLPN